MKPRTRKPAPPTYGSPGASDEALAKLKAAESNPEAEAHRHACEVRYVAGLADNVTRSSYLQGVEKRRGKPAAERLRADTWALMQGVRVPA